MFIGRLEDIIINNWNQLQFFKALTNYIGKASCLGLFFKHILSFMAQFHACGVSPKKGLPNPECGAYTLHSVLRGLLCRHKLHI